ncbi:MAG: hypothetical protein CSA62_04880 [Planctomycetota bacterium]|nr:MAG: hypothetical protein CSA62_04880 [Planctomycetota bacterium]
MLVIAVLQFELEIPWATSLKDKRGVVKSLKDRIRRKFNVSISETEDLDEHNTATLAAVMAGSDHRYMNGALDKLLAVLRELPNATLTDFQLEFI